MKDLQKLNGLDDDYDNDSGSGPHNVGRRKTIHNLEKAKQKKRNIGTLDVAFKKRFFNMNANDGPGKLILTFETHIKDVKKPDNLKTNRTFSASNVSSFQTTLTSEQP